MSNAYIDYVLSLTPEYLADKKDLLSQRGDEVVAEVTLKQVLSGLPGAKVLMSSIPGQAHYVDKQTGLHVAGFPMEEFLGESFARNYVRLQTGRSFRSDDAAEQAELDTELDSLAAAVEDIFEKGHAHFFKDAKTHSRFLALVDVLCGDSTVHPLDVVSSIICSQEQYSRVEQYLRKGVITPISYEDVLHDVLYLQGMLTAVIPAVYRKLYLDEDCIHPVKELGYSRRFARSLGIETSDAQLDQMERVFDVLFYLMSYHGPGNVSTQTCANAMSGFTNPWGAFVAMGKALKGVNHGGAAEMGCLQIFELIRKYGTTASDTELNAEAMDRISNRGEPGWCCGHRIIRGGDPREKAQSELLNQEFPNSEWHALAKSWYGQLCPVIASNTGAQFAENNVDSLTGVTLHELGVITDEEQAAFAGCIFLAARWIGAGSEVFWKCIGDRRSGTQRVPAVKPALFRPSAVQP